MTRILILGGYGRLGKLIAEYLVKSEPAVVVQLAGRNFKKANEAAVKLNNEYPDANVSPVRVDASNASEFVMALDDIDLLVVASSTLDHARSVAQAALMAGVDYLDTQLSSPAKLQVLYELKPQIIEHKKIFITDAGFHPGVPAAIVRWVHNQSGPLVRANVYAALKLNWTDLNVTKGTELEMVREFENFQSRIWKDNTWKDLGFSGAKDFDFGPPFGQQPCTAMMLEEMKWLIEEYPDLKEAGFYVTGFNWLLDYFLLPVIFLGVKWLPRGFTGFFARLFRFGLRFGRPPFGVQLVAHCETADQRFNVSIYHGDGYHLTAIPVVACILQYLNESIQPGLWLQSFAVEPDRFFNDLQRMGIQVQSQRNLLRHSQSVE